MKIFIKVLRGDGCVLEVSDRTTVLQLKERIELEMKVPLLQQTLVFMGKTLLDENPISFYDKIKDGSRVHLLVKKPESLTVVLERFLRKYYNEEQSKMILDEFMNDFHSRVKNLSLDDLERIATSYLNEETM